jgi:hypothetical protein
MELLLENLGEDELPLVEAMGVGYTVARIKKMILELCGRLAETPAGEEDGVTCNVLLQLLAFVSMKPLPDGMEPMSDCDRWTALRVLDRIRKSEITVETEKQEIYVVQFLLKGYDCAACRQ